MKNDWKQLTDLTNDQEISVKEVQVKESGICIQGEFELPPLAKLSMDDQVFVAAFIKCHGSIKEMEKFFGVSYPTIKARLKKIGSLLDLLNIEVSHTEEVVKEKIKDSKTSILDKVSSGNLSVEEALEELRK